MYSICWRFPLYARAILIQESKGSGGGKGDEGRTANEVKDRVKVSCFVNGE